MDTQKKVIIAMNDSFDEEETRQYIKTYMFIKGVAVARNLRQTNIALPLARRLHAGQYRKKSGTGNAKIHGHDRVYF